MVSAAMLPDSIHLAVPGCSRRGGVKRRSDGDTSNDDVDGGIWRSRMFVGG